MNRLVLLTLVSALSGCGSHPVSPSVNPPDSPSAALSFSLSLSSMGYGAPGLGSPTTVALSVFTTNGVSPGAVEGAAFKMFGAGGEVVAEAMLITSPPIRVGASPGEPATVGQTLTWSVEKGYGRRLEVLVTIRDGQGNTSVVPFSHVVS